MAENEAEERNTLADAIAQHLELKKQHGAPEEEVAQELDAALGKATREVEPAPVADVAPEPGPPMASEPEPEAEPVPEPERTPVDAIDESLEFDFVEPAPEPMPEPEPEPTPEPEAASAEPPAAEPSPPAQPRPADDPLESTPEFFEDTPEYDRLWFEEKAPRDFDF